MAKPDVKYANVEHEKMQQFANIVLLNRFVIQKKLSEGESGQIYLASDRERTGKIVLVKITRDHRMSKREYNILKKLTNLRSHRNLNFSKVYGQG